MDSTDLENSATNSDEKAIRLLFGYCNLSRAKSPLFEFCKSAPQWHLTIAASKCLKKSLLFQSMRILLVADYLIYKKGQVETWYFDKKTKELSGEKTCNWNEKDQQSDKIMLEISENNNLYYVRYARPDLARCWISKNSGILDFKRVQ